MNNGIFLKIDNRILLCDDILISENSIYGYNSNYGSSDGCFKKEYSTHERAKQVFEQISETIQHGKNYFELPRQ